MINNNTKVWIFILTSCLALLVVGYQLGERLGLLIGFLLSLLLNFFVFFYGESRVLAKLHAKRLKGQDSWGLISKVEKISAELGMPAPAIYITPHTSANAFCVGHSWKRGSLGFTAGLLQKLDEKELEAVVAHQICHIRRLDTFAFGVSSTLANSIVGLGQFLDNLLPYNLQFFMPLLSPVGWLIIKFVVGEKSFFENDLMASELLENRGRLGEVLWRMEGLAQTNPLEIPPCTSHLFMVNPEGFKQKNLFLKSHPAIEVRLQKLMGYYPI
ncbi:M56 family metallopeptidase [Bdellovibrio bacteriovorus]|uniref:M56 family metallopeptidase n=1 Tax=Bdellovibrio bacteriovorus TaxID=959 RepID=UPI0035A70C07